MLSAFPYIGGKTRLADWIQSHLPAHTTYVEPFGGSAAVLLNKPRSKVEIFNDKDGDVVNFFEVAREHPDKLAEFCRHVPFSEQLHSQWSDEYFAGEFPADKVERAAKWLFLRYSQYSGIVSTKSGFKREARNWVNVPERIDAVAERFGGVSVDNEDYSTIVERYDSPETVFYIDPPYHGKEGLYIERADHAELESVLQSIEGDAIVSYTEIPPGLYEDWIVVEKTVRHSAAGDGKTADERLLMNFDPDEADPFVEAQQSTLATIGGGRFDE